MLRKQSFLAALILVVVLAVVPFFASQENPPLVRGQTKKTPEPTGPPPPSEPSQSTDRNIAGEIFGVPVPMQNYIFAKAVAYIFAPPWGCAGMPPDECEKIIWENLVLHYESFRRGMQLAEEQLDKTINDVLRDHGQSFTRKGDPAAYQKWVREKLNEDVQLFENQIRYLSEVREVKDRMFEAAKVEVTEEEARERFLDEQNSLGGELVVFPTKAEGETFGQSVREEGGWDRMKQEGKHSIRPVGAMSLVAFVDLWQIPKQQIYALLAKETGAIDVVPFGPTQWGVLRMTEKRNASMAEFPQRRDEYFREIERAKKHRGVQQRIAELKQQARVRVFVGQE